MLRLHHHLLALCLGASGCLPVPTVYELPPDELEAKRRGVNSVAVVVARYAPESEQVRPGRGALGGSWRGLSRGFTLPIIIGFVAPLPGGTLLGLLVAPFTAVVGGVYGAFRGVEGSRIDEAQRTLDAVEARLIEERLAVQLGAEVLAAARRTDVWFEELPQLGPRSEGEELPYDELVDGSFDAVLELRVEALGLSGEWSIDPPTESFVRMRVRLYDARTGDRRLEELYTCAGSRPRTFTEWADRGGEALHDEFAACIPTLAEKVVDDLFLVYPLP